MNDIALKAGVSQTTVSFVLNGRSNDVKIGEETRQRVLETARQMGYRRNELARAMVTGKSRVVGLLAYDASTEHIAAIVAGALDEAAMSGYSTKVLHIPYLGTREEKSEVLHRCSSWRLDGTMSISLRAESMELLRAEMKSTACPVAYVENMPSDEHAIHVSTDAYIGIRAAVEHLVQLGHHRIAFMTGPEGMEITNQRNDIFLRLMRDFDLPLVKNRFLIGHWSDTAIIEKSLNGFFEGPKRASAIICPGDGAAMVAMREARRHGLSVPDDLSVIGFGNFNLGRYADPALTSIGQPFRDMGKVAMQRLLAYIEAEGPEPTPIPAPDLLPMSLVVRDSTALPYG